MQSIILAYGDSSRKDSEALKTTLRKVEVTYYNIEPFLVGPSRDWRTRIWDKFQQFSATCDKLRDQATRTPQYQTIIDASLRKQRDSFRAELYQALGSPSKRIVSRAVPQS
jgi:hypothetical protein